MLIDRCVIEVRSGKGGDGAINFLHDKNVEFGGPDGGNGGRGGSVYLLAVNNLSTLYNFRHSRLIAASDGEKGLRKNMYGHNADDVTVEVPVGTVVSLEKTGEILADLKKEGDRVMVAKGGRGGRGNAAFKSSRLRAPKIAENGIPGERKRIVLELKMLADAGLVGFPSVGKSTFLNVVSKANVPTADYPFTTLSPNLGVVNLKDGRSFVLADLPGLIEGAHEGRGLGITFLRHIERCRVLIHLVSMSGERDPYSDYKIIREELKDYGGGLEKRPEIVVASFMDAEGAEQRKAAFDKKLGQKSLPLSSLTHLGVDAILKKAMDTILITPEFPLKGMEQKEKIKVYDGHKENLAVFKVVREGPHSFRLVGERIERTFAIMNTSTDEGVTRLIRYLDSLGVEEALKKAGAEEGDEVHLKDFVFVYNE
jgi:GTP-binding protein